MTQNTVKCHSMIVKRHIVVVLQNKEKLNDGYLMLYDKDIKQHCHCQILNIHSVIKSFRLLYAIFPFQTRLVVLL